MRFTARMVVVAALVGSVGCQWMKGQRDSAPIVHKTCPGLSRPSTPETIHTTACEFPSPPAEEIVIPTPEQLGIKLK